MNLVESIARAKRNNDVPVIAEIKHTIPKLSDGCDKKRDAAALTKSYWEGGAVGISLVAEKKYFGGQPEIDIPVVLNSTDLPLLIKDFIKEESQVDYYAELASRVDPSFIDRVTLLLISHIVGDRLPRLLKHIHQKGMLALVETRSIEDLGRIEGFCAPPKLIGINNKSIDDLETGEDVLRVSKQMIEQYRGIVGETIIISESAHQNASDVRRSITAGADAVLVGTAFLTSSDPAATVVDFVKAKEVIR